MKENFIRIFSLTLKILLSISIIAAGLSLIYGCLLIYYTGDAGYSANEVREVFGKIQLPVYICLGLLAVSIIYHLLFPDFDKKLKNKVSPKAKLILLLTKKDFEKAEAQVINAFNKEDKKKKAVNIISAFAVAILNFVFLSFAVNPKNFDTSLINDSVIKAMYLLLPCLAGMFVTLTSAKLLTDKFCNNQLELIKNLPLKAKSDTSDYEAKADRKLYIIRYTVLAAAVVMIIIGLATDGVYDVLAKAVNICTECIGLG